MALQNIGPGSRPRFAHEWRKQRLYVLLYRGLLSKYIYGMLSMFEIGAIGNVEFVIAVLNSGHLEKRLRFTYDLRVPISHAKMIEYIKSYRLIDVLAHNEVCYAIRKLLRNKDLQQHIALSHVYFQ